MTGRALIGGTELPAGLERAVFQTGRSRFVLLHGAAGTGKTSTAEHVLGRWNGPSSSAMATEWETGSAGAVLHQAFPGLTLHSGALETAAELVRTASPATLIVVDDAQLSDVDSLRVLSSAIRHHPESRLCVLATATLDDPRAASAALELLPRIATDEFHLPLLGTAQISSLASTYGIALHPSMAEQLGAHTLGIPRYVVQLLTEVARPVWSRFDPDLPAPAAIAADARDRLARCSASARAFIEASAVLGQATAVRDVAALAGLDGDLLLVLDEACETGLVDVVSRGLTEVGPVNPMVRAAVLTGLGPQRRARLQRAAAELVDDPARSLRLLAAASPVPDADVAARLDALAVERAAEGAWAAAASLLSDASQVTADAGMRQSRIIRAVDALIGAGEVFRAAALAPEVESVRETPLRDAVLGYLAVVRGRAAEAGTRLSRAWDIVNAEREPDTAALICQRYVLDALARYSGEDLVTWADRAIELAGPGTPPAVEAAAIRGLGLAIVGQAKQAARDYGRLTGQIRHGAQTQRVVMARGWLGLLTDRLDDARVDLESAVPTTYLGGSARISLWARAWLARTYFLTGEWDEALRTVGEALPLVERSGILLTTPLLYWTSASVHALRGDGEQAEKALLLGEAGSQDYPIMQVPNLLARAQVAEARADSAGVVRALYPLTRRRATPGIDEPGHWPWHDLYAQALVLTGKHADADEFLVPHERLAAKRDHTSARARLASARGRLHGARGDLAGADASFDEARDLIGTLPLRYDQARIDFAYGQTLRRLGRRGRADTVLTTAREGFAALGATTYVARCERELKAGGVHLVRTDNARENLTPQEEAVTNLVAQGLSNREVAAELFLSAKTVQYHLTRVYSKLGIRSRTELAAMRRSDPQPGD